MEDLINKPVEKDQAIKIRRDQLKALPKAGLVFIRLRDSKRTAGLVVRSYGDRPFLMPSGQQRKYILEKNIKLEMEKEEDRLLYGQLINHPKFYRDENKRVFDIENKEEEADVLLKFKELEAKASAIIFKMSDNDIRDFARILLIPGVKNSSPNVLKKALFDKVELDAEGFLEEWNDSDKSFKILLRQCMDADICKKAQGRFLLNGQGIGNTFEQGIEWLKANEDMMPDLRKQLSKK